MRVQNPNHALKVAIIRSGKTQRDIAARADVPERKLSHFVRGRLSPTIDERKRLAKAIGRPESELFSAPIESES